MTWTDAQLEAALGTARYRAVMGLNPLPAGHEPGAPAKEKSVLDSDSQPGSVSLVLPFPPSLWTLYTIAGTRLVLTKSGKAYKALVALAARQQYRGQTPMTGRLRVLVEMHPPDKRRRDVHDNFGKAWTDALTEAGIWEDDAQIDDYHIVRGSLSQPAYLAVQITPMR